MYTTEISAFNNVFFAKIRGQKMLDIKAVVSVGIKENLNIFTVH